MDEFRKIVSGKIRRLGHDNYWAAKKLGLSYAAWCRRMRGDCPFKDNEISVLIKLLRFTDEDIIAAFGGGI